MVFKNTGEIYHKFVEKIGFMYLGHVKSFKRQLKYLPRSGNYKHQLKKEK